MTDRSAFSLLELLLVVAIIGLLAAAAVLTLLGPLRSATTEDLLQQLKELDRTGRRAAVQSGRPAQLVVDLNQGRFLLGVPEGSMDQQVVVEVARSHQLVRVQIGDEVHESGEIVVSISPGGRSSSYLLEVRDEQGLRRLLLFAGLSGQASIITDEQEELSILAMLAQPGVDTH